jgi:hypothetical protein
VFNRPIPANGSKVAFYAQVIERTPTYNRFLGRYEQHYVRAVCAVAMAGTAPTANGRIVDFDCLVMHA